MLKKTWYQLWQRKWFGLFFIPVLLIFVGCKSIPEKDFTPITLVPTPIATELPEGVRMAHEATMSYLTEEYDLPLPISADWSIEYNLADDLVGAGAYRLTVEGCVMTISNPLMAPDSYSYYVVLSDAASGLHWEGYLDCQGKVMPALSPQLSSSDRLAPSIPETINIVRLADLHNTVGIEICRLDCASYTPLYTIANPNLIAALVEALDIDMPLRPHARCPAVYQLRFILEDGRHYDFGYTCQMMTPTFLRGNQEFWKDQDAIVPDTFNALLMPLIEPNPVPDLLSDSA
jgi:hypothetical protein